MVKHKIINLVITGFAEMPDEKDDSKTPKKSKAKKNAKDKGVQEKKKKPGKGLTKGNTPVHDWDKIRVLFVEGVPTNPAEPDGDREWLTQKEISERLRVPYQSVMNRASKERWKAQKAEYQSRIAIERQKQRARKLGKESTEFDERGLSAGKVGMQLILTRLAEIAQEHTDKQDIRKKAQAAKAAGIPVDRYDLYSAIRSTEMVELANALRVFQEVGMKALGTNIERLEVQGQMEVSHSVSVVTELQREDPGRLAGQFAVLNRIPEFRAMLGEIDGINKELEGVIEGEVVEDDDQPEPEFFEDDEDD